MSKEKSDEYWQGYIQKQNESMEICKICRYRTKFRELEKQLAGSTPNSAIRKKKEKLEKEYEQALEKNSTKAFILKCQIEILEEILKEGEK